MARPQATVFTADAARKIYALTLQDIYRAAGRKFELEQNEPHVKKFIDFLVFHRASARHNPHSFSALISYTHASLAIREQINFQGAEILSLLDRMQTLDLNKSMRELTSIIQDFMIEIHIAQGDQGAARAKLHKEAGERGFTPDFVEFLLSLKHAMERQQGNRTQNMAPETNRDDAKRPR